MNVLREIHRFALPIPGVGHHLVLLAALLFLVSLFMVLRPTVPPLFVWLLRLNWLAYAVNAVTGILLAIMGLKVPSATADHVTGDGHKVTAFGFPVDSSRNLDHLMYAGFALVTLYVLELLIAGRVLKDGWLRRVVFVTATLFLLGVAYMAVRVAYFPGATPDA